MKSSPGVGSLSNNLCKSPLIPRLIPTSALPQIYVGAVNKNRSPQKLVPRPILAAKSGPPCQNQSPMQN